MHVIGANGRKMMRKFRPACLAALLAFTAMPAAAQDDPAAALAAIDASLPGTLINDPTTLDWRLTGERVRVANMADASIPGGGAATQYDVRRAGVNPWDVQAYVPLTADIAAGDTITFGFWARTISSSASDGKGRITARIQRDASPWPGFGDAPFTVGPEWSWHEGTTRSNINVPQSEAFMVFQLAGVQQTVEIGQTFVVSGAERILGNGARPAPPLPPQLAGRGALVSQPEPANFALLATSGSHVARDEPAIWLGRAIQFTSPAGAAQAWDLQASVPITDAIAAGDQFEIAIAARTVSANTEDGRARVRLRVQGNTPPFDGFGDTTFAVGQNWQLIRVRTTATMDVAAGGAVVALHFAGSEQVVDLGPVYVLKLPPVP